MAEEWDFLDTNWATEPKVNCWFTRVLSEAVESVEQFSCQQGLTTPHKALKEEELQARLLGLLGPF